MTENAKMSGTGVRSIARDATLSLMYGRVPSSSGRFGRAVAWGAQGVAVVRDALATREPCLIARLGSSELACVSFHERWRAWGPASIRYPSGLRRVMRTAAGVFPTDSASLDRFSNVFLQAVERTDVMGVWFNRNEDHIVGRFCPEARLIQLDALNPVLQEEPWTAALAGKVVLVVHPFSKSIESQYRDRRAQLFDNLKVLPEFELKTLPAVQSIAGNECGYDSWFRALEAMSEQVTEMDFDVAIKGAGAYGLPLAATVKDLGRQAVHLGGATQLLFGIKGHRWEVESPDDIVPLFNEHWVRPLPEETPDDIDLVENGCYW